MTVQLVKLGMASGTSSQAKGSNGLKDGDNSFVKCMDKSVRKKPTTDNRTSVKNNNDDSYTIMPNNRISEPEDAYVSKDVNLLDVHVVDGKLQASVIERESTAKLCGIDLDELVDAIRKYICKKLGIDDEEYYSALDESGVTTVNLLQVQYLQQFYVSVKGMEDFSAVLTDSGLSETWQMLCTEISEFTFTTADVSFSAEELAGLLEQMQQTQDMDDTAADDVDGRGQILQDGRTQDNTGKQEPEVVINTAGKASSDGNKDSSGTTDTGTGMSGETDVIPATKEDVRGADGTKPDSLFSQFMDRVEAAANTDGAEDVQPQLRQMRDISSQVINSIRVNVRPETTSLDIQLNPEQLGKVNVSVEMKNGVATASFIVKNEMARAALESQMQMLKDTFENQGLKVDAVEVSVSNFDLNSNGQPEYQGQGNDHSQGHFRNDDEIGAIGSFGDDVVSEQNDVTDNDGGINLTA